METELMTWLGFGLSILAAFLFSLFHISLNSFSKISLSRLLEKEPKSTRTKILDVFDELKISVEILRGIFLIAFLVYFFIIFPRLNLWPLWLLLLSLGAYLIVFDLLPRLINLFSKKRIFALFLPSYKIPYLIARIFAFFSRIMTVEREEDEQHEPSEEEIDVLIGEAEEEGIIEKEEGLLLKSVVEFGDTVVREIMTPRVSMACIKRSADLSQLRTLVNKEKHSRIPVFRERIDNIDGIVNAKDLLEYAEDKQATDPIDPLIRPVYFIPESMKVAELLKEFQDRKQKIAIVVDEHGGVSGLVTMEDLMEEIVGEIQDEYDKDQVRFIKQGPHDYIVSGSADVEDLEDLFHCELAADDYVTAGGLITHHLGHLPEKGEKIRIKELDLEILEVGQKRIRKLRIKKAPPPPKN